MGYISININYNEDTLCEEISFSEPGEQNYVTGSTIILSDSRLSRDRRLIVRNINYIEDEDAGVLTVVSGFSVEYKYVRKSPNCDISFFTMTDNEKDTYETENPSPDSQVFIMTGDEYGSYGWSMHSIVKKIAGWMGLSAINNLPDFFMSDYSISIGSTFFEAINSLVSEFEPLIILVDETLYILEKSGAGALSTGKITPIGFTNRSVDREYVPTPGCIKVEGGEGKYIPSKDPTYYGGVCGLTTVKEYSGAVIAPDGSSEEYSIIEETLDLTAHNTALVRRGQTSRLIDVTGFSSYVELTTDYTYDSNGILKENEETCKAEIGDDLISYNIIATAYEHNADQELKTQITSRKELFIFNSDDNSYVKYDPRDYDIANLAANERSVLIDSEIRTTKYSEIDSETYSVDTTIANKAYNTEEEEWQTFYAFEHDIVEAGGQQRRTSRRGRDTMQVYAGGCPITPDLSILDEPPKIFNIPTPDWNSIENCYVYLAALVSYEFQKTTATTPIIDPLPLMGIGGLGSIIGSGIIGRSYVRGYTINIDPNNGYTTDLDLEARRA